MNRILLGFVLCALFVCNSNAKRKVDSLRLALDFADEQQQVELLLKLSDLYFYMDIDSSLYFAQMSLAKAEVNDLPEEVLLATIRMAVVYQFLNKEKESLQHYSSADSLIQLLPHSHNAGIQYNYFKALSRLVEAKELDTALIFFKRSVDLSREFNEQFYQLRSLLNIGSLYYKKGQLHLALKSFKNSLEIADSLNDKRIRLYALFNIGNVYMAENNNLKALEVFRQSHALALDMQDQYLLGGITNNLAIMYNVIHKMDSAIYFIKKSIRYYEKNRNVVSAGHAYVNYGSFLLKKGQLDSAWLCAEKASALIDGEKNVQEQINLNGLYSDLYQEKGATAHQLKYLEASYDLAKKNRLTDLEVSCLDDLAEYEDMMGNHKMSNSYRKEAIVLRDSLYSHERSSQIAFLQKTFELDQKDRENQLLKAQNQINAAKLSNKRQRIQLLWVMIIACLIIIGIIILFMIVNYKKRKVTVQLNKRLAVLNQELEEANEMKNVLFSIMGHDLKSPVTSIISLSDLMIEQEATYFEDKEKRHKFINIINDSASMLLSFIDSMVYWFRDISGELAVRKIKISMHDFMKEMVSWYRSSARIKGIEIKLLGSEEFVIVSDMYMLQTVIRNLMGNAIKFSCKGSSIELNWHKTKDQVVISIRDYGVGLSEEQLIAYRSDKFMASTKGTEGEKGTGVGLYLCRELVRKIGGQLEVQSQQGEGTEFGIYLPQ